MSLHSGFWLPLQSVSPYSSPWMQCLNPPEQLFPLQSFIRNASPWGYFFFVFTHILHPCPPPKIRRISLRTWDLNLDITFCRRSLLTTLSSIYLGCLPPVTIPSYFSTNYSVLNSSPNLGGHRNNLQYLLIVDFYAPEQRLWFSRAWLSPHF